MNEKWQQYIHSLHISTTSVPATRWSSSFLFGYQLSRVQEHPRFMLFGMLHQLLSINSSAVSGQRRDIYSMARATRSGVIGPGLTEIHKSSVLAEFFFFFVSDLEDDTASPQQPQQQLLAWRQQQQWQHTTTIVRRTSRGSVRRTTRQTVL